MQENAVLGWITENFSLFFQISNESRFYSIEIHRYYFFYYFNYNLFLNKLENNKFDSRYLTA